MNRTKTPPAAPKALDLKSFIRDVPDFPKKGIVFKDITPLLSDPRAFEFMVERLCDSLAPGSVQKVAGIEARGFLLAAAVAQRLKTGVLLIRKKGKLPWKTVRMEYALEYGTDCVEAHADAAAPGEKVLLVDDVLATGGTASAACRLLEQLGARIVGPRFLIELDFLKGREKLKKYDLKSLLHY